MRTKFFLALAVQVNCLTTNCLSQKKIFCDSYPNGIVTVLYKMTHNNCYIYPLENPSLQITVRLAITGVIDGVRTEVRHVDDGLTTGVARIFEPQTKPPKAVLNTDSLTGKVFYSDVIHFDGRSKQELFNSFRALPQGMTKYKLMAEDNVNHDFQKYEGYFVAQFGRDQYYVVFNLKLSFKDGKVMYEYSDFITGLTYGKSSSFSWGYWWGTANYRQIDKYKTVDELYASDSRYKHQDKYWIPVVKSINESISMLTRQGEANSNW